MESSAAKPLLQLMATLRNQMLSSSIQSQLQRVKGRVQPQVKAKAISSSITSTKDTALKSEVKEEVVDGADDVVGTQRCGYALPVEPTGFSCSRKSSFNFQSLSSM